MGNLRQYVCLLALVWSCGFVTDAVAATAAPVPHLPVPISWRGTNELAMGAYDDAIVAVRPDTVVRADSLVRRLKLGTINALRGRTADAVPALERVANGCPILAPLAMEQLGDLATRNGDDNWAVTAYASALDAQGLTTRYREHLFAKVRRAVDKGALMPSEREWLGDYNKWRAKQRLFDAAGLEYVCDSLIRAGLIAEADSILERHMPDIGRREACRFIRRVFDARSTDSTKLTTRFIFSIATQANTCRDFALAERLLGMAKRRRDFRTAVQPRRALLLEANIAYSREQWSKAIELYKRFDATYGAESEAIMNTARAYRRLGNEAEMNRWYDRHVQHFPNHNQTQQVLWLRAWNQEERGNFRAAATAYRRITGTQGSRREEAHFRHALCHYKLQAYDSAAIHWGSFVKSFSQSSYMPGSMYWQGKALVAQGKTEEAHRLWNDFARTDPTDYYAHRARQLMGNADSASRAFTAALVAEMTDAQAREWLERISPSQKKQLTAKDSLDLRRGAALLSIARPDLADMFLDNFENNYSNNLLLQYDLAMAYAMARDEARAFKVARRLSWRIPRDSRNGIPIQVLSLMYPQYYSMNIGESALEFNVDPLFISSVMRQESIFDKNIVSPAGAAGLMQIMPATGRTIAQELKVAFSEDSLFSYPYNIRFGAYYLRKRLSQFNESPVLALCSYNGGAHNAAKWRDRSKHTDQDLFVEDIGFFETRGYVKKVMGNYWTYAGLMRVPGYRYELPKPIEEMPKLNVSSW